MDPGAWATWARRRRVLLGAIAVILLAVRVALPPVLRRVMVSQANAAVAGRVDIGDVDLWLLRGGLALEDVALHAEDAPPDAAPLVAFRRLYVNVGWLAFLRRTVRVQDVELDGLAVNVDRLHDGSLVLPAPRPAPEPAKPAESPPAAGKPWNIVVDRAALRDGRLRLRDHVVDPPEDVALGLGEIAVRGFSVQYAVGARPAHGMIEARFGDGVVRVKTRLARQEKGFAAHARVKATNLPLDRAQVHVPQLGWKNLAGRLDTLVVVHAEPAEPPTLSGTIALRDLRIDVPSESGPALAWRRLDVAIGTLDPLSHRAIVDRVALDGGEVIVTPRGPVPAPVVPVRHETAAPAAAPPAAEAPAPWTWKVGAVEVTDTRAHVVLEPPPLELRIAKASITGLSSEPGSKATCDLEVHEGDGTITLHGTVGLDPVGASVTARIDRLALERLVAASGAAPVRLPGGVLSGDVAVEAPKPLVVKGDLALDELSAVPREGGDFALGWKRLELGMREVRVASGEPLRVDLERLHLVAPTVELTRTETGLVLPTAPAASGEQVTAPADPAASAPGPPPALALGALELEGGQVAVVDRSVKPFYQGKVGAIALKAHALRFPENTFDDFTFGATLPGNAPLSLTGKRARNAVQLQGNARRIPLAQLNPYVKQAAGLSISRGAVTFGSTVRWGPQRYESESKIQLDQLALAGAEGDSLFGQHFGVPLSLALGLMRDVHGRIALTVPVQGDRAGGAHIDLGAVLVEALTHAIVNALASPLKLLGAVNVLGGKVEGFTPEPVGFAAGKTAVDEASKERISQVAGLLASSPALRVELRGMAGADDERALREAKVLADLEAERGVFGAVKNVASGGERKAIREALTTGAKEKLSEGQRATLEKWVAAKSVSDDELRTLAAGRAEKLRDTLAREHGIVDRVTVGEVQVDREKGRAGVDLSLGGG